MTFTRKMGWVLFFAAVILAAVYLAYKIVTPFIWPLPFDGPYQGRVLDARTGRPIPGTQVEAVWVCRDRPGSDGSTLYRVLATVDTDAGGRFRLDKPFRRRGFFGTNFLLNVRAPGFIEKTFLLDPENLPLPEETRRYPFTDTIVRPSMPPSLEVRLNPARPVLIKTLESGVPWHRSQAARMLGLMGPEAAFAVSALIARLGDEDAGVREAAAVALGAVGPKSAPAVPALSTLLVDENEWVRRKAARALGAIGPAAKDAVPALADMLLTDPERTVREEAARALGNIGPAAKSALPALKKAVQDPEGWVGNEAQRALEKIAAEE